MKYTFKCSNCNGSKCKLSTNGCDGEAPSDPYTCPWNDGSVDKSNWIPTYEGHSKGYYISCKGTLISSAYIKREHAQNFIDEWDLLHCEVVEI